MCERQRQTQGTGAPGCVGAAQPLGSDVRAHGEGSLRWAAGRRRELAGAGLADARRLHASGVMRAGVGDPHKAWPAFVNRVRLTGQTILGF